MQAKRNPAAFSSADSQTASLSLMGETAAGHRRLHFKQRMRPAAGLSTGTPLSARQTVEGDGRGEGENTGSPRLWMVSVHAAMARTAFLLG